MFVAPNDDVPKAGAAVAAELLPNTGSAFVDVPAVVDPNRFVAGACVAAVTTGDPNETDEPNAGGALLFAPNVPKTGVAAEPLNAVDEPNAGGAVGVLRLNDPPKLGIEAVVVGVAADGVPNRFADGVCVVSVAALVFSIFAPNKFGVAVLVFATPNGDGLAGEATVELAPNVNVLLPPRADVVTVGAADGAPNEMPEGFGAVKLNVEAVELVIDVVEGAVPVDGAAVVVVAVKPNDGPAGNAPKDDAPNDGGVAVGADIVAGTGEPFRFLPNENGAIDCALVVGKFIEAVVAVTPNDVVKLVLFGGADAPKLKPPAAGIVFAVASEAGAAAIGVETVEIAAAGFPNENAGKGVIVGMVSSCFFVCVGCEAFKFKSAFEAMAGAGVVIVAPKENPPRRGSDSLDVAVIVVKLVVEAAVVAFNANEIFGFDGSLNVGRGILLGKASALFAFDVAIVATIGLVGFVAPPDTSVTGAAMNAPFFCFSVPVETADGRLKTDVVVAVLNVTVVWSPVLNDAVLDATAIGNSLIFFLSGGTPLSTSSRDSPSLK